MFITLAIRPRTYNFCNSYQVSVLYPTDVFRIYEENGLKEVETPALAFRSDAQRRRDSKDHRV